MSQTLINPHDRRPWAFRLERFDEPTIVPPVVVPPVVPPVVVEPPPKSVEDQLAEALADVEQWKGHSRTHEDKAKANAEAARKLKELEDAKLPELEREKAAREAAEKKATDTVRRSVASEIRALADDFVDKNDAIVNLAADEGGLDRFVNADGEVDLAAIGTALTTVLENKQHLKKAGVVVVPPKDPSLGPRGGPDDQNFRTADKAEFASELGKYKLRPRST